MVRPTPILPLLLGRALIFSLTVASLSACASSDRLPWVWHEAELPQGFPPPGPVGQIQIKHYPAYRAAVQHAQPTSSASQGQLFRPLLQHLRKNNLAMTAPVEMTYQTSAVPAQPPRLTAMAFLYTRSDLSPGPPPESPEPPEPPGTIPASDGDVKVKDVPPMKVLSIGVRGRYSQRRFQDALDRLHDHLATYFGQYQAVGPPRYLGYNSPMVPWFLRYGEVQLPIAQPTPDPGSPLSPGDRPPLQTAP